MKIEQPDDWETFQRKSEQRSLACVIGHTCELLIDISLYLALAGIGVFGVAWVIWKIIRSVIA